MATDLGKLDNGVTLTQFGMGKGEVGVQLTGKNGYVHLDVDSAVQLSKKLNQWTDMRAKGELARPGDMDETNDPELSEIKRLAGL